MSASPRLVATVADLRAAVVDARRAGQTIGFVPTMGALHAGHARLVEVARQETAFVVVSIFVNPKQFGPNEDLNRYPRTLEADQAICQQAGADVIYLPPVEAMYPAGFRTFVEVQGLGDSLCGPSRPGHFRGVATVVAKLFNQVQPDVAYFGQKDAQQARILHQLARDLDFPIRLVLVPTVREPDGLALSSRNRYLSTEERKLAPGVYQALLAVRDAVSSGERNVARLERVLADRVAAISGARLDYGRIVDADTLHPIEWLNGPALVALAVFLGSTRLIDNLFLDPARSIG